MSDRSFPEGVTALRLLAASASVAGKEIGIPAEPHPDAELLELIATYLDLCAEAEVIEREARLGPSPYVGSPQFDAAIRRWEKKEAEARRILNRVSKTRASTAAGVYAKATIVITRRGYMTAPRFMHSLAEDLVSNTTLRAILWPAGAQH